MIPWRYFALTLGFSWTLWASAILLGKGLESLLGYVLYIVGGIGPAVAALSLLRLESSDPLGLVKESISFGSLEPRSVAAIVAVSVIPNVAAVVISERGVSQLLPGTSLGSLLPWFVFLFLVSVIEEVGWRGYALPRLLESYSTIASSTVLGAVWALWHVPLFLLLGTWQYAQGFGSPIFWRYLVQIIPRTFLYMGLHQERKQPAFDGGFPLIVEHVRRAPRRDIQGGCTPDDLGDPPSRRPFVCLDSRAA